MKFRPNYRNFRFICKYTKYVYRLSTIPILDTIEPYRCVHTTLNLAPFKKSLDTPDISGFKLETPTNPIVVFVVPLAHSHRCPTESSACMTLYSITILS